MPKIEDLFEIYPITCVIFNYLSDGDLCNLAEALPEKSGMIMQALQTRSIKFSMFFEPGAFYCDDGVYYVSIKNILLPMCVSEKIDRVKFKQKQVERLINKISRKIKPDVSAFNKDEKCQLLNELMRKSQYHGDVHVLFCTLVALNPKSFSCSCDAIWYVHIYERLSFQYFSRPSEILILHSLHRDLPNYFNAKSLTSEKVDILLNGPITYSTLDGYYVDISEKYYKKEYAAVHYIFTQNNEKADNLRPERDPDRVSKIPIHLLKPSEGLIGRSLVV
jgi:hypothetical protein